MGMIFCRGCGKEIHETALVCPNCGAVQYAAVVTEQTSANDSLWLPIASLVLGIIGVLSLLGDSQWDNNQIVGLGIFSLVGFVLGVVSLSKQKTGKGMATAGVVLAVISGLAFIGMVSG